MTRTGDGAEAPPVADAARRRKGKSQAGKAAPKLPPHAPITFLGDELVEFDSPLFAPKQKKSAKSVDLTVFGDPYDFAVCFGFALHTAWPRLVRSALAG